MENRTGLDHIRAELADALAHYAPEAESEAVYADRWILASGMQKAASAARKRRAFRKKLEQKSE